MKYFIIATKNDKPYSHKWQNSKPTGEQLDDYIDETDADDIVVITDAQMKNMLADGRAIPALAVNNKSTVVKAIKEKLGDLLAELDNGNIDAFKFISKVQDLKNNI